MNCKIGKLATLGAAFALAFGFVTPSTASAQVFTGRIDVTLEDTTGGRLPGVSVDLTGPVNQNQVSDANGEAHFLNLPVGIYTVKATLSGFNEFTNANVQVATGAATPIAVKMGVAGTSETVNVTAATPIIDVKRETTTTNVTLEELQNIPSARDPWVVMQTVPTIYVDRVNVGGSESGQQSNYIGKGTSTLENTWNLDGVPITDMGATGSSPTYYQFDMFQEMSVTTGGADAQNPTPGVALNLVLKKGSNTPHGNASTYFENEGLQATNIPDDLVATIGGTGKKGNRTDKYLDSAFDLGGPIFKNRLFAWGSLGYTDVRNLTLTSQLDETKLKNSAFKADGNINDTIRANFAFFRGDKQKNGRGVGPTHLIETAWNQTGPTSMYKGEGNFVIGQKLFAAARYAYVSGGFTLDPIGGRDKDFYKDDAGVWHNTYYYYTTKRPQYYLGGDASYFAGKHEVKFGFAWRKTPVNSISEVTGSRIFDIHVGYPDMVAYAQRDNNSNTEGRYSNAWVTDTISMDRLTVTAGIRYDHATSSYLETFSHGVPGIPLLPDITAPGVPDAYKFNTIGPRIGVTYALDSGRKTVARASYALFASQLPGNAAAFLSPIQPYTYVYYNAVDKQTNGQPCVTVGANGCDGVASLAEINFAQGVQGSNNVDLTNPSKISSSNIVNKDLGSQKTNELMFGVDREVMPNFGVSATFTYRYMNNFIWNPGIGVKASQYVQTGTFTGTFANVGTVSIPYYGLKNQTGPGREAINRPDYHQRYLGFELSATKRLSNKWMARFGFATTSWNEYFDSAEGRLDPTPNPAFRLGSFTNYTATGPNIDGGPVVQQTGGSGKSGIYMLPPKYQMTANGLYQAGWGIDLGANFVLRQGYGQPFYRDRVNTGDALVATKTILMTQGTDEFRLDTVSTFDMRAEKMFKFGKSSLALDFDVFNLFNKATVLGKQYNARVTTYNQVLEIMNPRIARLGVRFFF
jgi:Carboxypeptidase regulatory-like domain/TonB-dependent Receptor Plug Domain